MYGPAWPGEGLLGTDLYFRYVSPLVHRKNCWIKPMNQEYLVPFLVIKQLLSSKQNIGTHLIPTEEMRKAGKKGKLASNELEDTPNTLLHTK